MIFIRYDEAEGNKAEINYMHYQPFNKLDGLNMTESELNEIGALVDAIPEKPKEEIGKIIKLFFNPQTKEIWYEYIDRPLTPEEEITNLKAKLQTTQDAVDFLLMGGM